MVGCLGVRPRCCTCTSGQSDTNLQGGVDLSGFARTPRAPASPRSLRARYAHDTARGALPRHALRHNPRETPVTTGLGTGFSILYRRHTRRGTWRGTCTVRGAWMCSLVRVPSNVFHSSRLATSRSHCACASPRSSPRSSPRASPRASPCLPPRPSPRLPLVYHNFTRHLGNACQVWFTAITPATHQPSVVHCHHTSNTPANEARHEPPPLHPRHQR